MRKLMFATALAASVAAFADPITAINFEGYTVGSTVGNFDTDTPDAAGGDTTPRFVYDGTADDSTVKAYGQGEDPAIRTAWFTTNATENLNYLELSTGDGTLWRSIKRATSTTVDEQTTWSIGDPQSVDEGIYLDTLVQFTAWEDDAPTVGEADKLAVWLSVTNVTNEGVEKPMTNLMVRAGYRDASSFRITNYVLQGKTIEAGKWYRLTIKAVDDVVIQTSEYASYYNLPTFEIWIDGDQMGASQPTFDTELAGNLVTGGLISEDTKTKFTTGKYFLSMVQGAHGTPNTLQAVGFQGTGAVDDIVWTTEDPISQTPSVVEYTLTLTGGENATVAYVIGEGESQTWDGSSTITVKKGDSITFTATPAEGFTYDGATHGDWTLSGTEITYTLANITEATTVAVPSAVAETPAEEDYKVAIAGSDVVITPSAAMIAALKLGENPSVTDVNAALAAGIGNTGIPTWQALFLGLDATAEGLEEFKVGSIEIVDGKVQLKMAEGVTLATDCGLDIVLKVFGSDEPSVSTDETETNKPLATVTNATEFELTPVLGETKKFYKVKVEFTAATPAAGE